MRNSVSERASTWAACPYRYLQMPQSKCAKLLFLGHLSRSIQRRQSISRGREQDSNSDGNGHGMEISWPSFARLLHNRGGRNHHHAQQSQFHQLITFGNNPHLPSHPKKYSNLNLLASESVLILKGTLQGVSVNLQVKAGYENPYCLLSCNPHVGTSGHTGHTHTHTEPKGGSAWPRSRCQHDPHHQHQQQ